MDESSTSHGITGRMTDLYDVFVDWEGRLGREMPGLEQRLSGARRVLDAGCGTGRHVQALGARGFEAHGADVSADMLARARELGLEEERLHLWRMGQAPPAPLVKAAPFDAVVSLGNVWPMLTDPRQLEATGEALRALLVPGGRLVLGLKAFGVRRRSGQPYLPLLKRMHDGRPLWFVRFVDFDVEQPEEGHALCDLHMSILAGNALGGSEALLHDATRVRAWEPDELATWFQAAGFVDVRVSGRMDDPDAAPTGEDVFVAAQLAD